MHDTIRKTATDHYLSNANKKMNLCQDSLNVIANEFNLNDCVRIAIHPVDGTNIEQQYLLCLIIEKTEKNDRFLHKLICQYDVLENKFEVGHLLNLKDPCPNEFKQMNVDNLKTITLIKASKLYSCGYKTGCTCNCHGKCATRTCPYKKENVFCSTKYHSKRGACSNMD